jgi:hypothetical protein
MMLRALLVATTALGLVSGAAQAQNFLTLTSRQPRDGVVYGFLMTDGSVMYQGGNIYDWYKFTPDAYGSYQNGTWSVLASLPLGYGPYATGGGVLPDGRLLLTGGEYLVNKADTKLKFALTTKSAIYDPRANAWTMIEPLKSWIAVGDSPGTVRADGLFMLGDKITRHDAVLDPVKLQWVPVKAPGKHDINAEEGWTLLPDGSIFAADVTRAPGAERFIPGSEPTQGTWVSAGDTPEFLKFTWHGKNALPIPYKHDGTTYTYTPAGEIGPAILRPDGSVFQTGALETAPVKASAAHNVVYYPPGPSGGTGGWATAPDFQGIDDAGDEWAVLLPNGNVLVEANTDGSDDGDDDFHLHADRINRFLGKGLPAAPSLLPHTAASAATEAKRNPCKPYPEQTYHLYEFDGTNFPITGDILSCGNSPALLVLPNGQTMVGGFALYTSVSGNPAPDWAPVITTYPHTLSEGSTYTIYGKQFTGLSQAAEYGDEFPTPTNYPLVRLTNRVTGHVVYARTHDWSTSAVATGSLIVSTQFDVPDGIDPGKSVLEVVANGIASRPVTVTIK